VQSPAEEMETDLEESESITPALNEELTLSLIQQVRQDNLASVLYELFTKLLELLKKQSSEKEPIPRASVDFSGEDKTLTTRTDIYTLKRSAKSGSFEVWLLLCFTPFCFLQLRLG